MNIFAPPIRDGAILPMAKRGHLPSAPNAFDNEHIQAAKRFEALFCSPSIPAAQHELPAALRWIAPKSLPNLPDIDEAVTITIDSDAIVRIGGPQQYIGIRLVCIIQARSIMPGTLVREGTKVDYIIHSPVAQYRVHRVRKLRGAFADLELIAWDLKKPGYFFDLSSRYWPPLVITVPLVVVSSGLVKGYDELEVQAEHTIKGEDLESMITVQDVCSSSLSNPPPFQRFKRLLSRLAFKFISQN